MDELLESHRRQEDRMIEGLAEKADPGVAATQIGEHPVAQAQALKGGAVVAQGQLVRRAAGQVGPGLGRHTLAGEGLVVGDRGDFGRYLLELGKGRHGGRAQVFDQCRSRLW
ncbi:hypothetical protein D3C79_898810 [compost metagenome]